MTQQAHYLTEADLAAYEDDPRACWVQNVYQSRVHWANPGALQVLQADDPDELYARDVSPLSAASRTRIWSYLERICKGEQVVTQWTTFARGIPVTLLCELLPFRLPDGQPTLFFCTRVIDDYVCPEGLRMLEAARQSSTNFVMMQMDGTWLEQNAAFMRAFGDRHDQPIDHLRALLVDAELAETIRGAAQTTGHWRGRAQVLTLEGPRWHMLLANRIHDPVLGQTILHLEMIDINDQVQAEERARQAEQLLERIADEIPQPVAYISRDRELRFVNRTYASWMSRSRKDLIGATVAEVGGALADERWSTHWPTLEAGERAQYERLTDYNGTQRWINVELIPNVDEDGTVQGSFLFGYDIHALKLARASQQASEAELTQIADNLPLGVCKFDLDHRVAFANERFCQFFGLRRDALIGRHIADFMTPEQYQDSLPKVAQATSGETVHWRRDVSQQQQKRWLDITLSPYRGDDGTISGLLAVYQDVTSRVRADMALSQARMSLAAHLRNTPLAVIQLDAQRSITQWTGRAEVVFVWAAAQVEGKRLDALRLFEEEDSQRFASALAALDGGSSERFTMQLRNLRRDGTSLHAEWHGSVLRDAAGKVESYLMLVQDISARVSAESHLHYLSNHDLLTGLANRGQFRERLEADVARAHRFGRHLGVVLVDLDRFKYVNDSLGHQAGDTLLQQVATRLKTVIGDGDLLARAGGDEFMLLLDLADDPGRAHAIVQHINQTLHTPLHVLDQDVFITASIGVAIYPEDASNHIDLLKNADWAMYRAKDAGRNNVQFFARTSANDSPMRLSMDVELRRALERAQLELHYQPKIALGGGQLTGVEALLRWRHPQRGLIPPELFIPMAEETGLIHEIGYWVIRQAAMQVANWRDDWQEAVQVAINLSAVQLRRPELSGEILAELKRHSLPGSALMVEVTETSLVTDPLLAVETLEALRSQGIHTAIDDFGKGFSSLMQLKRLPIDALKIDGSFIHDVVVDRDDAAIVQAIVGLAHNLDLKVIAECVETADQLAFLKRINCDQAQGYLLGRPMPASEFEKNFFGGR
jgi:diguanylate cyclase (GGDEF)-like protein/PAS domain S-box-containing protein